MVPGESETHQRLKKASCWWLWNQGFRAVAAEVPLPGIGVVDAVAAGRPGGDISRAITLGGGTIAETRKPARRSPRWNPCPWQSTIIECKVSRSDFLRDAADHDQMRLVLDERRRQVLLGRMAIRSYRRRGPLGKFTACLARPLANVHWLLTPPRLLLPDDLPPRWGLLEEQEDGLRVIVPAKWQTGVGLRIIEASIARTLTAATYAAESRAVTNSLNRLLRKEQIRSAQLMTKRLDEFAAQESK